MIAIGLMALGALALILLALVAWGIATLATDMDGY